MEVIGVIPARYHSKRLPFKLLREILGKPLIQWTWENAQRASNLDKLIIACDDERIKKTAEDFGAEVVLTSVEHNSGTDRIAEAIRDLEVKIVVNIQADEPLIHPSVIDELVAVLKKDSSISMVTAKTEIVDQKEIEDPNVVKVVTDKDDFALYFSRWPIPYLRDREFIPRYYKHLGIYAYTKDFLYLFKNMPPSSLEKAEKLEQLRVLEAGYKIKVITTQFDSYGVDTEQDLIKVEEILRKNLIHKNNA